MRTRVYNKMTGREVEGYLTRGGKTMYVAVGVTEVHGAMPIDCEGIFPEAVALALAEETDGLAMVNMPYFFPGGTVISNATVQVSVRESIDYLMMITRSLVSQGFDKIFSLSGHGPARLYIDAMCRDFFQETKVHVCHLNLMYVMQKLGSSTGFGAFEKMIYGAYKMMHQMEYLAVDPNGETIEPQPIFEDSALDILQKALQPLGIQASMYYELPEQHFGGTPFKSEEERLAACEEGEKLIREMAEKMAPMMKKAQKALDIYHAYVKQVVEKYPHTK